MPSGRSKGTVFLDLRVKTLMDHSGGSLTGKRVLDLGCLEGGFSLYLAKQGAREVVGIEARELNYERCLLLKDFFKLSNLTFHKSDVRMVRNDWLGEFDIIFAGGILYHLDDPYVVLQQLSQMVKDFLLVDTHVALREYRIFPKHKLSRHITERLFEGETYPGRWATEFQPTASHQEIEESNWSSWGNAKSFWLLEESLVRMLMRLGFPNVSKVYNTPGYNRCAEGCPEGCRVILVAKKTWNLSSTTG